MKRIGLIATVASLGLIAACSSNGTPSSQSASHNSTSGALIVNTSTPPATIDPAEALNTGDFIVPTAAYVTLVRYATKAGPKGTRVANYNSVKPYLAKSWSISKDAKTYTFHLNKNFKFNDGSPINAAAVKFTFERAIKMNGGGLYYLNNGQFKPPLFKAIDTPDPYTVIFHLSVPLEGLLTNWAQPAGSIVEPSVVTKHGGVQKNTVNKWVAGHIAGGGGPYIVSSYSPGTGATLTKNPNYPLPVKTKVIKLNFITDSSTLALNAQTGEADITIGAQPSLAHSLESNSNVKVIAYPTPLLEYLGFNTQKQPGNNHALRTALTYATPYSAILQKAVFGYGTSYYGPIIPTMSGFNAALSKPRSYDLSKAKDILASAGVKTPINLTVTLESGDQAAAVIGPIIKDYWAKIGVNVTLQTLSPSAYVSATEGGKVEAYIRNAGPGVPTPGYYLGYSMRCGVSFNLTRMCVPSLDKLLDAGIKTANPQDQQKYWNQITTQWRGYSPRVIFYGLKQPVILSKKVKYFSYINEFSMKYDWGF